MQRTSHRQLIVKRSIAKFEGLKSLATSAAILDASGTIVAVNDAWKQFGRQNGLQLPRAGIGSSYLENCRSDELRTRRCIKELRALLTGRRSLVTFVYPCHSPTMERWFVLIGLPLSLDKPSGVALLHVNLTEMLPLPIRAAQAPQMAQIHSLINFDAISGAVERSVSDTLASQLNAMFKAAGRSTAGKETTEGENDQMTHVRARLSNRQVQVLRLLGEGKTNKEMAKALSLSPNTVKLHVSSILQRLKLRSRTHAALLASTLDK